jgi:CRISPR/Cas system-associated endonuclease Cas3-HD
MQISIEQIIQVIMAKLENIELSLEDIKFRSNVAVRILRDNDMLNQEDVEKAVKEEFEALKELDEEREEVSQEQIKQVSKGIIQWADNDLDEMKDRIKNYQDQMKEMMDKENSKADISVAPSNFIDQLDSNKKNGKGNGSGNIIMP